MNTQRTWPLVLALLLAITALSTNAAAAQGPVEAAPAGLDPAAALAAVGSSFTYQGRLNDGGSPANGAYDFQFLLYDAASGGTQISSTVAKNDIAVSNGLFAVPIDFGSGAFDGSARWLAIRVRSGASSGSYTTLSPRQALTAVPYALGLQPGAIVNGAAGTILTLSGGDIGLFSEGESWGVYGESNSATGRGLFGYAGAASGETYGVYGWSDSPGGRGVYGRASANSGDAWGVYGSSASPAGRGVVGEATASSGATYGVYGWNRSTDGRGVVGEAVATSGATYGVYGQSASPGGRGVAGIASAASGATYGVYGQSVSPTGRAVVGVVNATSGATYGVYGQSSSTGGRGVVGVANASSGLTYGVHGQSASPEGYGVYGLVTAGNAYGVFGQSTSTSGRGVVGFASADSGNAIGVYGQGASPTGYAGYFNGRVHVAGTLSKAAGSFKIDHPLDPANQYLYHSFVESPDMKNIYDGVAALDESGAAWVELPAYFQALNRDFRYQLTPIGGWAPLYIARKLQDNRFQIAGGEPGMEVSWQVTGIRQDAYANAHRIPVEEPKPAGERGLYLHPAELGQPAELGLDHQRNAQFGRAEAVAPLSAGDGE